MALLIPGDKKINYRKQLTRQRSSAAKPTRCCILNSRRTILVASASDLLLSTSQKGAEQPLLFGPCLLWPNGRPSQLLLSTCTNGRPKTTVQTSRNFLNMLSMAVARFFPVDSTLCTSGFVDDVVCRCRVDELFGRAMRLSSHVLHALIPPQSSASQRYNLRHRPHLLQLPSHTTRLSDSNFITRMLYKDKY